MNAPSPGLRIGERWELLERLGAGAMGDVWRGRHLVLGHEVAVKLLKPEASRSRELVQRFEREARIAAQLRHRHVARVEDFGATPEGAPWLVMELLRGESLDSLLAARGRLDPATVVTVARHVGAACDAAHAAGIVHRDLKPANCFLVREEGDAALVKVLDFGVAKAADGLKLTAHDAQLIGTPVYMSPEQTAGPASIDGRSDLWSLAVMLYELLTGRLPFRADSLPGLLVAIVSAPVPPPTAHDPSLPPAVDAWAARALDRDRERRFQTGRELADALAAALGPCLPRTREMPAELAATAFGASTGQRPPAAPSDAELATASTLSGPMPSAPPPAPLQTPPPPAPTFYPPVTAAPSYPAPPSMHPAPAYVHVPPPPSRRPAGLLVAGAVVLTAALVSLGWALLLRDPAPSQAPPAEAPQPPPAAAAPTAPSLPVTPLPPPAALPSAAAPSAAAHTSRRHSRRGERSPSAPSTPSSPPTHHGAWNPDEP